MCFVAELESMHFSILYSFYRNLFSAMLLPNVMVLVLLVFSNYSHHYRLFIYLNLVSLWQFVIF